MTGAGRPVLRRCVACRCLSDRRRLWRVIRLAGGGIALCPQATCLEEARRRRRLQRALRCQVADSIIGALASRLDPTAGADAEAR
jgi:predicted RNA-binding protein YlxR (DUF448 family)